MLRWRLLLGTLIIAALVGLCWLDHLAYLAAVPGVWLLPVAMIFVLLTTGEVLELAEAGGMRPLRWPVYAGNLLIVLSSWLPEICRCDAQSTPRVPAPGWVLVSLAAGVMLVFVGEMRRYEKPGGVMRNVVAAVFGLVYVGLLLGLIVQLRMAWGVAALASLVIVVKAGDIGAYTIGRLFGRHKLAPVLSPGKTVEGVLGALAFACLASWVTFGWLVPAMATDGARTPWWGWLPFGLWVATAGIAGDLAESLIKRDAGRKDSSSWLPGLGGVLDVLDSILFAAPVAWICWATRLVGG